MDIKQLIRDYLSEHRVMQIATSVNNQPWVCNIHYIADEDFNIYWISTPQRRHSLEIAENPNVAFVIKVHEDTDNEPYVIGLSGEGKASLVPENEVETVGKKYFAKTGKSSSILDDILSGKNPHRFYKMNVKKFTLFDTNNFPDNPRQEIEV